MSFGYSLRSSPQLTTITRITSYSLRMVMSRNTQVSDWRSAIDITKNGWVLDVIRLCPDFTFPSEWLAAFKDERVATFAKLYRNEIRYDPENPDSVVATPDGATWKDWADSPRPSLIPEEEGRRCARYMLWTHYIKFLRVDQLPGDIPRPLKNICARLSELREEFTDDELMRYQKEVNSSNTHTTKTIFPLTDV